MKKLLLVWALIAVSPALPGEGDTVTWKIEKQIHRSLPTFIFRKVGAAGDIAVETGTGEPQILKGVASGFSKEFYLLFGDYNFDGFLDASVMRDTGASQLRYNVYLWNPKERRFELHPGLSDFYNLSVEGDKKQLIDSYSTMGGRMGSRTTYMWEKGELKKIEEKHWAPPEEQQNEPDEDDDE